MDQQNVEGQLQPDAVAFQPAAVAPPPPAQQQQQMSGPLSLQPFWSSNPEAWFALAEGQFYLRNITDSTARFYIAANAIPESLFRTMGDLLRGPPPPDAYEVLKARLVASHSLSEYQRMELLLQHKPLGGQRPTEVLADLTQLCPAGETGTRIFRLLFLHRLPRELRIILSEDITSSLSALAARADMLWSHTPHTGSDAVAAVCDHPDAVAAIRHQQRDGGKVNKQKNKRREAPKKHLTPEDKAAQAASGLCVAHWRYGEDAFSCRQPCSWSEN
jgi:hypothetical protein